MQRTPLDLLDLGKITNLVLLRDSEVNLVATIRLRRQRASEAESQFCADLELNLAIVALIVCALVLSASWERNYLFQNFCPSDTIGARGLAASCALNYSSLTTLYGSSSCSKFSLSNSMTGSAV